MENLTFCHVFKNFASFYGTRNVISIFTTTLPLVPILSQMNPVYVQPSHLSMILFNIIVPSRSRFFKWSPSLRFFHQKPVRTSSLPSPLPGQKLYIPFRNMLHFYVEQFLASQQTHKPRATPCRLSATCYS